MVIEQVITVIRAKRGTQSAEVVKDSEIEKIKNNHRSSSSKIQRKKNVFGRGGGSRKEERSFLSKTFAGKHTWKFHAVEAAEMSHISLWEAKKSKSTVP